jgi:hypothetical protein
MWAKARFEGKWISFRATDFNVQLALMASGQKKKVKLHHCHVKCSRANILTILNSSDWLGNCLFAIILTVHAIK